VADPRGTHEPKRAQGDAGAVIDPPEIIEAARSQPGMSSGDFNIFEWVAYGVGVVVAGLSAVVVKLWYSAEGKNAKDITILMAINDRLEKEIGEMRRVQLSMTAQNAALENENANLKERVRELEQRLQRYEQGHGA
jgi:hypothetical protein